MLILHCTGRLVFGDETAAFHARVKHMLLGTNQIVINLSGMEYIDSAGLGTLVGLLASTRNRHGTVQPPQTSGMNIFPMVRTPFAPVTAPGNSPRRGSCAESVRILQLVKDGAN